MNKFYFFTIGVFLSFSTLMAQDSYKDSNKEFKKGLQVYNKSEISHALDHFEKAIALDSSNASAYLHAGLSEFILKQDMEKCAFYFEECIEAQGEKIIYPEALYYLVYANIYLEKFDDAERVLNQLIPYVKEGKSGGLLLKEMNEIKKVIQNNKDRRVNKDQKLALVEGAINTNYPEYGLIVSKDSTMAFYTSRSLIAEGEGFYNDFFKKEDVYQVDDFQKLRADQSSDFEVMKFNSKDQEAVVGVFNGDPIVIKKGKLFAIINNDLQKLNLDLKIKGEVVSIFQSKDKGYLFAVAGLDKEEENRDIYMFKVDENGNIGDPQRLAINSDQNEDAPFLDNKNEFFYFSSDRPNGYGGYDVYKCTFNNGEFSTPELLDAPINGVGDDIYFFTINDDEGFISAYRATGKGHMDIYHVRLTCDGLPKVIVEGQIDLTDTLVKYQDLHLGAYDSLGMYDEIDINENGTFYYAAATEVKVQFKLFRDSLHPHVYGVQTNKYCEQDTIHAHLKFINDDSGDEVQEKSILAVNSNPDNNESHQDLANMNTSESGKYDKNEEGELVAQEDGKYHVIHENVAYVPNDVPGINLDSTRIYFAFDKYAFNSKEQFDLKEIADYLKNNDSKLLIIGHTDNIGSKSYNQKLSEARAEEVKKYLIINGVDQNKLETKGEGEEQPMVDNKSKENRAQNRRVEFKWIEPGK